MSPLHNPLARGRIDFAQAAQYHQTVAANTLLGMTSLLTGMALECRKDHPMLESVIRSELTHAMVRAFEETARTSASRLPKNERTVLFLSWDLERSSVVNL